MIGEYAKIQALVGAVVALRESERELRGQLHAQLCDWRAWPVSIRQAAARIGVNPTAVHAWLKRGKGLSVENIEALARVVCRPKTLTP